MNIFMLDADTFCADTIKIWSLIGFVVNVLKIAIPIIVVLMATIDLGKAVIAGKEDEIKNAQKLLIKRVIYGVLVFFIVTIVQALVGLVGGNLTTGDNAICWQCATGNKEATYKDSNNTDITKTCSIK